MIINKGRFAIFGIISAVFILLILWKFFSLMILSDPGESYWSESTDVERGPIWDRNGEILAMQVQLQSLATWRPDLGNKEKISFLLSGIIDMPEGEINQILQGETGFDWIKRKLSATESKKIEELIDAEDLPGIILRPEYGRIYPKKDIAGYIIGFTGMDNHGSAGLEFWYDDYLSPKPKSGEEGTVYGNQLYLTIDINLQYLAEQTAQKTLEKYDADNVMILVMDAKNGDFLAIASYPGFDPNNNENWNENDIFGPPFAFAYEPGSVFKVFSISSFLQTNSITPNDEFFCNGYYEKDFGNGVIESIDCLGNHGSVNAQKIIMESCNAGAAYASEQIDKESFYNTLTLFGFGSQTSLPYPGESNGILAYWEDWSGMTKPTIAMGQGISVSAVQLITAATVLTNNGQLLEPHIVDRIVSPKGEIIQQTNRKIAADVMSPENAREMLSYMITATSPSGTARRAAIEGIVVAAKTGTAEVWDRNIGNYSEKEFIASCLGILPASDPELIVYVVIDYPKKESFYGGVIAAPVVGQIGEELVTYLGIPRDDEEIVYHSGSVTIYGMDKIEIGDIVPDLLGFSKRDLAAIILDDRFDVIINGNGWVISQSPPAGTPIGEKTKLILELK